MQTPKKYKVIELPPQNEAYAKRGISPPFSLGEIVYDLMHNDYGGASSDSRILGVECTSVTRDPTGNYPYQTIPISMLEEI